MRPLPKTLLIAVVAYCQRSVKMAEEDDRQEGVALNGSTTTVFFHIFLLLGMKAFFIVVDRLWNVSIHETCN